MALLRWKTAQYFEKRWWNRYLKKKDHAEYLQWKQNYWLVFLQEISEWVTPSHEHKYLDMGCGPAGIFMVLPGEVTAVDPLLEKYKIHLSHFKPDTFQNATFYSVSAEDFVCSEPFDVVFSLNVINHVADIGKALKTLHTCCKPGGKLVISVDAHNFIFLRYVFSFLHFDILHPHQLTLNEYRQLLESKGFVIQGEKCLRKAYIFNYVVFVAEKP